MTVKIAKVGAWMFVCGVAAFFVGYLPGAGPCGPSTGLGILLHYLGLAAALFAAPMVICGLLAGFLVRVTRNS